MTSDYEDEWPEKDEAEIAKAEALAYVPPTAPGYYIETIEPETGIFTPQKGVPHGPYTKWGLREGIRALRAAGYSPRDNFAAIYRVYSPAEAKKLRAANRRRLRKMPGQEAAGK